jgi:hypothetical protein
MRDLPLLASIILERCVFDPTSIGSPIPRERRRFLVYFQYLVALQRVTITSNIQDEPGIQFISISGQRIMTLLCDHDKKAKKPPFKSKL